MVEHRKRKKFHDKDKYYRLAKEQGLRSRAAFKLSQINRKFHILENAKIVIDLCAAPGGWTQVISRSLPQSSHQESLIIAVDILPIRPIPNVITLIGDITTDQCKSQIRSEMQGCALGADVVLCDGAPNVGASYDKDAYQQNEIALHALKCATEHLKRNGTFVTKLYRSQDYSSYLWVAKQFFEEVRAVKPTSSRTQSAEIFLVCLGYVAPTKIDGKLLDPKFVFESVEGDTTGGGSKTTNSAGSAQGAGKFNVLHKNWDMKKRSRQGYDMTNLDASMRNVGCVCDFVEGGSGSGCGGSSKDVTGVDPIAMLGMCTGLSFSCHLCRETNKMKDEDEEEGEEKRPGCNCKFYLEHELTTPEIKACVSDLKVLNKSDFKGLLSWRSKMQDAAKVERASAEEDDDDASSSSAAAADGKNGNNNEEEDSEEEEERQVQAEIQSLRERKLRERKRLKKKERELMAKRRRRAALGMDLNAVEVPDNDKIFSLTAITSKGDLEAVREVDLDKVTDEDLVGMGDDDDDSDDDDDVVDDDGKTAPVGGNGVKNKGASQKKVLPPDSQGEEDDIDSDTGYDYRLDRELDDAYDRYLATTKNGEAKSGTKLAKRTKKLRRQKAMEEAEEDAEMMMMMQEKGEEEKGIMDRDTRVYAKMLRGPKDSDDDDDDSDEEKEDDEDDDGFDAEPMTPEEHSAALLKKKKNKENRKTTKVGRKDQTKKTSGGNDSDDDVRNPLIHQFPDDPASVKTARWFSNPLFESIGSAALSASMSGGGDDVEGAPKGRGDGRGKDNDDDDYDSEDDEEEDDHVVEAMSSDDDNEEEDGTGLPAKENKYATTTKKGKKTDKKQKENQSAEKNVPSQGVNAEDVLAMMPKTDKQVRHERRLKAMEREERKKARRAKKAGIAEEDFEVVNAPSSAPNDYDDEEEILNGDEKLAGLDEKQKRKVLEARALIKAGMGTVVVEKDDGKDTSFEVVSAAETRKSSSGGPLLPVMDSRKYDSENEDYDSDDYAETLALGTMMLRRSKAKALVDASYNRFAWNDPEDLPDWFVDDENRHYRPQLPIPPALLAKMKEKFLNLSTKPIAKVAEARARKNKRARDKLAAAKKKAEAVANSSDLSETMKLKAISKAMRGQDLKKPGKTYVVSRKGGKTKGGKGMKLVDKRMKNDKKSMERAQKKRKGGKVGGLTGSKKRRHHK